MKTAAITLVVAAVVLLVAGLASTVTAATHAAVNLHVLPADFSNLCSAVDVDTMDCSSIVAVGDSSTTQFVFVLTSGLGTVAGVQFGVAYDSTVTVAAWVDCTGGLQIPTSSWPSSGSGNAVVWDEASVSSADSLFVVGYFMVTSGSSGRLAIIDDPRLGGVTLVGDDNVSFDVGDAMRGVASLDGQNGGFVPCGGTILDMEQRVVAMFSRETIRFVPGVAGGTPGQAVVASDTLASVIESFQVARIVQSYPGFAMDDTLGTARTGEPVRLGDRSGVYGLDLAAGRDADSLVIALMQCPKTLHAAVDSFDSVDLIVPLPDDEILQDGLDGSDADGNAGLWNVYMDPSVYATRADIQVVGVWHAYTQGSPTTTIAICDRGIAADEHPEFAARVIRDVAHPDEPFEGNQHSYYVAGMAAAKGNNGIGIAGVDWNARILSTVISGAGVGVDSVVARLRRTSDYGAQVVNISRAFGGEFLEWRWAYEDMHQLNQLVVASMGNSKAEGVFYPAAFRTVMAVGSSDIDGLHADHSTFGDHIDLVAPGEKVWTTARSVDSDAYGRYANLTGTSLAAPQVAGLAGLLLAYAEDSLSYELYNDDISNILKLSADDIAYYDQALQDSVDLGWDVYTGAGRINASRAFAYLRYPFALVHGQSIGGSVFATEDTTVMRLFSVAGVPDGEEYRVVRKEVRGAVTFSSAFEEPPTVWGRATATRGMAVVDATYFSPPGVLHNFGTGWCEPVENTVTATGCTMRTYVYQLVTGPVGTYPAIADSVIFGYTALGYPDSVVTVATEHTAQSPVIKILGVRPSATIELELRMSSADDAELRVFDIGGRQVRILINGNVRRGVHDIIWDGRTDRGSRAGAGVYFIKGTVGRSYEFSDRVVLLK